MIDLISKIDVTSRMGPGQVRKILSEIFNYNPNLISFTKHAITQMRERNLKTEDVLNVLKVGIILNFAEFEKGSFKYRV